jgi:hypothetical protein
VSATLLVIIVKAFGLIRSARLIYPEAEHYILAEKPLKLQDIIGQLSMSENESFSLILAHR